MATITPSIVPGSYFDPQTVNFTFTPDVTGVVITVNAAPPTISKYIAYDNLTPANPFLAVTEDGRGRVVYDGGFPKFYNNQNPAAATFAELTGAGKYLHNAIQWVRNPAKFNGGNKKVLFIGDTGEDNIYNIKSVDTSGFLTTIQTVCSISDAIPTVINLTDFDGVQLNPTLAYLEQFACVVFIGSNSGANLPLITTQAINAFVTYRENGNGLVFITDHGEFLTSIEDTKLPGGGQFFKTVNGIIYNFGAYFTGNYDRTPVNVGFLRLNYGDHPLYANLNDADSIYAGASESRVVVSDSVITPPGSVSGILIDQNGINTINVLAMLVDGSVVTTRIVYNIQGQEFLFVTSYNPVSTVEEVNGGIAFATMAGQVDIRPTVDATTLGTVWGEILLRGKRVGEIHAVDAAVTEVYWYATSLDQMLVRKGDVIDVAIRSPFNYIKSFVVNKDEAQISDKLALVSIFKNVADAKLFGVSSYMNQTKAFDLVLTTINKDSQPSVKQLLKTSVIGAVMQLRDFTNNRLQITPIPSASIYSTTAAALQAVSAAPSVPSLPIIDAATNSVYGYLNGIIQKLVGLKAQDFFGAPRTVVSTKEGSTITYHLDLNGSINVVS